MKLKWKTIIALLIIGNLLGSLLSGINIKFWESFAWNFAFDLKIEWARPIVIVLNLMILGLIFLWKEKKTSDDI